MNEKELLERIAANQERIITLLETNQARTERAIIRAGQQAYYSVIADDTDVMQARAYLEKDSLSRQERREVGQRIKQARKS